MRFAFDEFTLDTDVFELRHRDVVRPLQPKPLDLLCYLLERRDRVVLKGELLSRLWSDVHVTENALAQAVACVREALADAKAPPIQAVRGRGYRFVLPVRELASHARVEPGCSGFVAPPGKALELEVARAVLAIEGARVTSASATRSGDLRSFRALLQAHARAFRSDTVGGVPLAAALAGARTDQALADLTVAFILDASLPATLLVLERLERAELATVLLFSSLVALPDACVTLVGTCAIEGLAPGGAAACLLLSPSSSNAHSRNRMS